MRDNAPLSRMDYSFLNLPSPVTPLNSRLLDDKNIHLFIKRDELIHPDLQGNKWRKLKYNIERARQLQQDTLLTFGGAYSNHIHATAAAGHLFNFKTIGIIRGEEYNPLNPTLEDARNWGMQLHYVNRVEYRQKTEKNFLEKLVEQYGDFYLIPEGGNNEYAIQGCAEIIDEVEGEYDYICVDCGTGATASGIIYGSGGNSQILVFPVLKNASFISNDIITTLNKYTNGNFYNWKLILDYHFGGFAKTKPELFEFINNFEREFGVILDPVYTGKMLYGIFDMIKNNYFKKESRILVLHTGGLQGKRGYNNN
ncbi:MAG: pyridoxal-phosphate dependent enzyme [Gammaproteobacteria bacterium]|nr:pyridoxal-phosphate dependent enzyme [Gammaproteobacteria bacterium]